MANEILPAGIGDLTTQEAMAAEFLFLLAAHGGAGFLSHPALFHASAPNPTSNVVRVPHLGLRGTNILSATTPGSEVANTALSDGSTDVTIAMRALRYTADDLARWMANGKLDPALFARSAVISINETWLDTGGPVRSLLIAIFGWVAEQERIRMGERTKAGLERARRQGVVIGRPRRSIDIRRAESLLDKGLSLREVAKRLKVPASTLHRALGRSKKG